MDTWEELSHWEERFEAEGFDEGVSRAAEQSLQDGYQIGLNAGQQVGQEIGFYQHVVQRCLHALAQQDQLAIEGDTKAPKQKRHLEQIQTLLHDFPQHNVIGVDTEGILCKIRLRYQMAMAMMGLSNETRYNSEKTPEDDKARACAPTAANDLSF